MIANLTKQPSSCQHCFSKLILRNLKLIFSIHQGRRNLKLTASLYNFSPDEGKNPLWLTWFQHSRWTLKIKFCTAHPNAALGCGYFKWCYIIKIKECSRPSHPNVHVSLPLLLACSESGMAVSEVSAAKAPLEHPHCAITVLTASSLIFLWI